jgi:RNA polymerase sigma-70 factor (ECF subfamily)
MTAQTHHDDVEIFETHRRALLGLAYRMLGSRAEAEDVVQDAYLRWHAADQATIEQPRSYLGTIVTRLCLDRLKSAQARREIYVGQWLPEPVVDEAFNEPDAHDVAHDISVALIMTLERLSPLERASFLLHDVFGVDFAQIGEVLGRGEAACRQLAARARTHVQSSRPRFTVSPEDGRRLAVAFQQAVASGNVQMLTSLLAEDAVLHSDGGGKRPAPLQPIYGVDKILRFFAGVRRKNPDMASIEMRSATVNGLAGLIMREVDGSLATMALETREGRIVAIYLTRNPEKLRHVRF